MDEYNRGACFLIMYADHNPDDRVLVKEAFADISPKVKIVSVPDGKTLLDHLFPHTQPQTNVGEVLLPDAILLEINMPENDGVEALAAIKSDPRTRHIPVIVFSTFASGKDKRKALKLGANSFIRKPRSFAQLKATLRAVIEQFTEATALSPGYRSFPNLDTVTH